MATASNIISSAMRKINAMDANESLDASDFATSVDALNGMMTRWEADGLSNGWSDVENPGDECHFPPEIKLAVIYNLAIELAPEFGQQVSAPVAKNAATYLAGLQRDAYVASPLHTNTDMPRSTRGVLWNIYSDSPRY